jgi:hypothetical protein
MWGGCLVIPMAHSSVMTLRQKLSRAPLGVASERGRVSCECIEVLSLLGRKLMDALHCR